MGSADDLPHAPASPPLSAGERIALGIVASMLIHAALYFGIRALPAAKPAKSTPLKVRLAASAPAEAIRPAQAKAQAHVADGPSTPAEAPVPHAIQALSDTFASAPERERAQAAPDPQAEASRLKPEATPAAPSAASPQEEQAASAFEGEQGPLPTLSVPLVDDPTYYPARQLDASAAPIEPVMPDYPQRAAEKNMSGKVVLLLLIDEKGNVRDASVVSVDPDGWGFEEAALAAFQGQKFKPAIKNGHAVKSRFLISVTFELTGAGRLR